MCVRGARQHVRVQLCLCAPLPATARVAGRRSEPTQIVEALPHQLGMPVASAALVPPPARSCLAGKAAGAVAHVARRSKPQPGDEVAERLAPYDHAAIIGKLARGGLPR